MFRSLPESRLDPPGPNSAHAPSAPPLPYLPPPPPGWVGGPAGADRERPAPWSAPVVPAAPQAPRWVQSADERRGAKLGLLTLLFSLMGFIGVAVLLYEFKFHGVTSSLDGLTTRVIFVAAILFAVSPFVLSGFRRVPVVFLFLPLLLVFFLYPIFSPYGIPYARDPVFLYQFAHTLQTTGAWTPASGVTEQAVTYSYYPGAATFSAEASSLTGIPLVSLFPWATELFRFLVIPPAIYALTARMFSPKASALAVLLYAVQPSIEMNIPTQQDFAVTFFVLTLVSLAFLTLETTSDTLFLRFSTVMASSVVVVSHHVSTYLLLAIVGTLALLPRVMWRHEPYPAARSLPVFLRILAFAVLWAGLVALPVLKLQWTILTSNLGALIHPSPAASTIPGASFPGYEIGWVGLAVLVASVIAILTLLDAKKLDDRSFVTVAIISAVMLGVFSIPFLSTGFSFLGLREFEYTGVIFAPVTAWWITERMATGRPRPAPLVPQPVPTVPSPPTLSPRPPVRGPRHPRATVLVVALVVTGGMLVPLSTRDQFAPVQEYQVDSSTRINHDAYAAAEWAAEHLSRAHKVWGDYLAYTVFGGFGDLGIVWDSYVLFNGTGFSLQAISVLDVGSYVVTDPYLTTTFSYPMFFGPGADQPSAPLTAGELAKFQNPLYFAVVFENPVFTIYVVTAIPPAV
jgi:hypothetical protein